MARMLRGTRYLVLVPILGLAIAAAFFFVIGGIGLIRLLVELLLGALGAAHAGESPGTSLIIVEVVEYVHTFLVGTVLYITAVGLYQLFIEEVAFVGWLKIENTEELETNLIGVTVVVLAVNFMGTILASGAERLLDYGAGIALPIAALGMFVGLRAWAAKLAQADGGPAGKRWEQPLAQGGGKAREDDRALIATDSAGGVIAQARGDPEEARGPARPAK